MNVILKPTSHPQLGEINIADSRFVIGRSEPLFASHDDSAVAKLSAQHAHIFQERGSAYLVDLGSRNGTKLNGRAVEKAPMELHDGDEVCFADRLCYKVQLLDYARKGAEPRRTSSLDRVTLVPEKSDTGLETITIDRFPYLINRDTEVFAPYKESFPVEIKYLSRGHACLVNKGNDFYLEDLGSTNGTWVDGTRLEAHAEKRLQDGASIVFGCSHFSYTVKLEKEDVGDAKGKDPIVASADDEGNETVTDLPAPNTVYMNAAGSFLDIFCHQKDVEDGGDGLSEDAEAQEPAKKPGKSGDTPAARPQALQKIRIFSSELKGALRDEKPANSKRTWQITGVIGLALLVIAGVYVYGVSEREIKDLLAQKQYLESAEKANRYLEKHPNDKEISALATEALVKYVVPDWKKHLENARFTEADALLADAKDHSQFNDQGLRMLELLGWVGKLEKFLTERGGADAPLVIFKHESQVESLLEWWDEDASGHDHLLVRILNYVPGFKNVLAQTMSQLRMLRSEESVYLKAIAALKQTLQDNLAASHGEELAAVLSDFEDKYPKIAGTERLRADINTFVAIQNAIAEKNLAEVLRLHDAEFETPPFREQAANWIDDQLPPETTLMEYQKALDAWAAGKSKFAVATLEPLTEAPWGEVAARELERMKKITKEYQALAAMRQDADYGKRLLAFASKLDPVGDRFFLDVIDNDFQQQMEQALKKAGDLFRLAKGSWNAYQTDGGISGFLRVEKQISESFKQQSQRLSEAYQQVTLGAHFYELLSATYPSDSKKLYDNIRAEAKRQFQWLSDLRLVLEPSLLEAKLQLLPELQENHP